MRIGEKLISKFIFKLNQLLFVNKSSYNLRTVILELKEMIWKLRLVCILLLLGRVNILPMKIYSRERRKNKSLFLFLKMNKKNVKNNSILNFNNNNNNNNSLIICFELFVYIYKLNYITNESLF